MEMIVEKSLKNPDCNWVDEILWPPCLLEELKADDQGCFRKMNLEKFWLIAKQTLIEDSVLDGSAGSLQGKLHHEQYYSYFFYIYLLPYSHSNQVFSIKSDGFDSILTHIYLMISWSRCHNFQNFVMNNCFQRWWKITNMNLSKASIILKFN